LLEPGNRTWALRQVEVVLNMLGLERIEKNVTTNNETNHEGWNLFWTYWHQDRYQIQHKNVEYHQLVNHLPNNHVFTSKSLLSTGMVSKYIPRGFLNFEDLKNYATQHPNKRFVEKSRNNRHITIKNITEIRFEDHGKEGYFAQEFVENPLLYDGHKFEFSLFVIITSFDPLRVYYDKYFHLRICPKPHDAKNFSDPDTYIIASNCLDCYEFNSSSKFYNNSYTNIDAVNTYLRQHNIDEKKVWNDVDDLIRTLFYAKEKDFIEGSKRYGSKFSFFEIVRMDLILDNDLNLYVMEVNESPSLWEFNNDHFMHHNLLLNLFKMLGIGSTYMHGDFHFK